MIYAITPERISGGMGWNCPTPAGLLTDLPALLALHTLGTRKDPCTLLLPASPGPSTRDELTAAIRAAGWNTGNTLGGWFVCRHKGTRAKLQLCVLPWADNNDALVYPHIEAEHQSSVACTLVAGLDRWAILVGTPYAYNPGASALTSLREHLAGRRIFWQLQNRNTMQWWTPPWHIVDLRLDARGTVDSHMFDLRSAYLAAAAHVDLPAQPLYHTGTDPALGERVPPGYYRIRVTRPNGAGATTRSSVEVYARLVRPDRHGTTWACAPTLTWLTQAGAQVEIVDSWTAPLGTRLLRSWAEHWRDAMASLDPWEHDMRAALKQGYSHALGGLLGTPGHTYRPDWRHAIIDHVRASMLRRIARAHELLDVFPLSVFVDEVTYSSAVPLEQLSQALGVGSQIGRMKYTSPTRVLGGER